MLRIAVIAGTYQPEHCGVAHYTSHLRDALAQQDVESIVLTTYGAAEAVNDPTVKGVVRDWSVSSLIALVRAIHATRADLLHIQHAAGTYGFDRAIFLLPLLLKLSGWTAPIITTVHEYGWWEWHPPGIPAPLLEWLKTWGQQRRWWDREDGFLLTQSDAVITTNSDAEQVIQTRLPELKPIVHRIPIAANIAVAPIDRIQARQKLRHLCGWSEDVAIVTFFGFLHPVKGLETLLPAFQKVLAAQPHARLLLVGGVESLALPHEQATHYWNQLQALVDNLGLNAVVHMTGRLEADAVSHCLYGADIGVLPFNHGVTLKSGSLLAMMAHALPVLATCSDPADPDLDEQLVRSIAPRDANGLATELIELLSNPTLQHQLGSAGYQFSQQFSWTEITKAHLRVYQTALAHRSLAAQKANVNFSEATSSRASGDRPLRILAYTDSAGIGGAEISLGHLVGSASKDIEITVVGISEQVVNAIAERRSHINSQFCSQFSSFSHSQISRIMLPKRGIRSFIAHLQTFQRLHPDIVHLNLCTPWAGAIGLATALLLPHLRVVRVDQLPLRTTDALTLWRTRFLCLRVDAHVAVGEASARRMEDFYALGRNSVISIPNCVPDPGEPLPPPDRPPGQMTVGSIGRLDAMKAHDLLLQAIAQVEGVRLVILGEGDQRAALETLAIELGVRDRLSLVGWVDDPQSYLAEFDVVALPSRSEGFPLVMVEAMLAARPIVATRVGSIPEAVIDNKTGILIEKNDVAGLAIALRQLRDNPLQRIQLGKQAREMAVTHFTVGAMTANYERLWHKLRTVPRKPRLWIPRPQD